MKRLLGSILLYVVVLVSATCGLSGCVVVPYDHGGYGYHHYHGYQHHGGSWGHDYRG